MYAYSRCKFFYLKHIAITQKGEIPVFACKKGYDITTNCNESCTVFQQSQPQATLPYLNYRFWNSLV